MRISYWSSDVCSSDLAEGVAEVVRMEFRKALGAVATLEQKGLALGDAGELVRQVARLAGKAERRIAREFALRRSQRGLVGAGGKQIGRASCRERVCQSVSISVVAVSLKTNKKTHYCKY